MFIDEAKLTARLAHPKIAQTYELGRHDDKLYIAMEFVDGIDTLALLRECAHQRKRLRPELVIHIVCEVLDALLHVLGLVRALDRHVEHHAERLQRELVDRVDLVEVVQDEVEDGRERRGRPVELARLVDLERGLLGLGDLDLDLGRSLLGDSRLRRGALRALILIAAAAFRLGCVT